MDFDFDAKAAASADRLASFDFDDPWAAWLALPIAVVVTVLAKLLVLPDMMLWYFFAIPVHEMGHALSGWLSGRRVIPVGALILMAGMTFYFSFERSLTVYLLLLAGLLRLFVFACRRSSVGLGGLALLLMLLQFKMTWAQSATQAKMLFTLGGLTGEYLLSTLLVLAYFYRLPLPRWDFFRYLALMAGTYVLASAWWLWHRIAKGRAEMPLGSFLNGRGDSGGDLNQLMEVHGWTQSQLLQYFKHLGSICLWVVLVHYLWAGFRALQFRHRGR